MQAPLPHPTVRRVVTGTDGLGRSHVLMDGNPAQGFGGFLTPVWVTDRIPADNTGTTDNADRPIRLEPPPGGVKIVYFTVAPESESAAIPAAEREQSRAARFEALVPRHSDFDRLNESGTKWANAHGADSEGLIGIFARIDFKESKSLCRGTRRQSRPCRYVPAPWHAQDRNRRLRYRVVRRSGSRTGRRRGPFEAV
jgi:hypothetical protein